jgi:hypothetical protein
MFSAARRRPFRCREGIAALKKQNKRIIIFGYTCHFSLNQMQIILLDSQITTKKYIIIFLLKFNGVDLSKANNGLVALVGLLQVAITGQGLVDQMSSIGCPIKWRSG